MLDLHKLAIFMQVAERGSFSRAAEHLLMTQSGVSQHVQELEARLGTRLFERKRRGVELTQAGEVLHDYATTILQLVAEAELAVTDVANLREGQLTLGATPGVSAYLMPEWVPSFRNELPQISVTLQTNTTAHILAQLQSQQLELGFIEGEVDVQEHPDLVVIELRSVQQLIVVGREHPWWSRAEVMLAELDRQPMVMRQPRSQTRIWLDALFQQHGIEPEVVAEFDNLESMKRLVMGSRYLTILPDYAVQTERQIGALRGLQLADLPLERTLKLVRNRHIFCAPVARAFLRHLHMTFPQLREQLRPVVAVSGIGSR